MTCPPFHLKEELLHKCILLGDAPPIEGYYRHIFGEITTTLLP